MPGSKEVKAVGGVGGGAEYAKMKFPLETAVGGGELAALINNFWIRHTEKELKEPSKIIKMNYLEECGVLLIFTSTWCVMRGRVCR